MKLQDELPIDHRLSQVYRFGAGLGGIFLIIFGSLGLANHPSFLDTHGKNVIGLSSNGTLSVLSIVMGAVLIVGAVVGGNFASNLNMIVGLLFILSGFVGLIVLDGSANRLAFKIPNVIFAFAFGFAVLTFGMYGRVSSHLPQDNPYWRKRHSKPETLPSGPITVVKIFRPGPPKPTGH